ncbi:Carbon starvation protein CstA [Parapedobacter luteus]|uniref:Carbon starvation protein CstA n=1 Tax=Parapedobacter luteus TaxID=623280 RepID=A0A1T5AG99_9SPHI|nr:carbon starvation CstA family protein [Parapedobacter luteus]SKB33777.1 Carbon starvation protein CstA [Parapedobacter luteus]
MITFFICVGVLIVGYYSYGLICERIFGIDRNRPTPAMEMADGVDYVPLPRWKSFLIQFLNIAGLGPIFGAVAGAMWGPVAFLWIVLGTLIAGGVHDYFSGMLSLRNQGKSFTEITGKYLGRPLMQVMRVLTLVLLIMVGTVFFVGPAQILAGLSGTGWMSVTVWSIIILCYYLLSTILPIDKVIGRFYPIFGAVFLTMTVALWVAMVYGGLPVPELSISTLGINQHIHPEKFPAFPMLFITIACGAVSGFHATQSPLIARCLQHEGQGRSVFYGTMVTEGVVAMIWAAVSMSFFGGIRELNVFMDERSGNAAMAVNEICTGLLGRLGGILAVIGVVVAPVTSGDTAFRSARLLLADIFNLGQRALKNRLLLAVPMFCLAYGISLMDFGVIWRYFAWTNQTLATVVLWTVTAYLINAGKNYWIALIPALFMTNVVVSYILIAPEGLSLPHGFSYSCGIAVGVGLLLYTFWYIYRKGKYVVSVDNR